MAAPKVEKKRKRTRKARTEVSSSSSSSSSEDSDSPPSTRSDPKKHAINGKEGDGVSSDHPVTIEGHRPAAAEPTSQEPQFIDPGQAFEEFYLKQATKELSGDLDKLRTAPDFKDSSVPILIEALRQGTACFSREERQRIGVAGMEANTTG